jgi:uncharacterized membrane protein YdcZ (DUF606 family)
VKRFFVVAFLLALAQPACVVGGYSNRSGWFFWPGGLIGLLVVIAVIFLLAKRRK